MKTIAEIRREKLELLIKEFGSQDHVAELGKTSPVYLSQIRNQTPDEKTGKPRQMGDRSARKLETGCGKELGWMDNAPTMIEIYGEKDPRVLMLAMMESLPEYEWPIAVRLVGAIAQPSNKNGTAN